MVFLTRKMAVTPLVSLGLADKVYTPGIIFITGKLKYVPAVAVPLRVKLPSALTVHVTPLMVSEAALGGIKFFPVTATV